MRFFFISIVFAVCGTASLLAQTTISSEKTGTPMAYRLENGDTLYYAYLQEVVVRVPRRFRSAAEERQFWRLVGNVKKVYPYARLAGVKLHGMNEQYLSIESERARKEYSKKVEDELRAEFEGELRKLTITQGRILLRLVDRETGNTTYDIVKDFRGTLPAVFWQAIAKIFGSNLKTNYDPSSGEDRTIERIIKEIEEGTL